MRAPLRWIASYVDLPPNATGREMARRLTAAGLQVERVETTGEGISGVVVARVARLEELAGFKKPVRWVTVDDGTSERQVICGATNFAVDDLVAYARPPATLPGGFTITARTTYGHVSDGMLCSGKELGLSDDHAGILVLEPGLPLGADVVTTLELRDEVLDISINPDRGYALSIRGVAREVATAFGASFRDPADIPLPAPTGPAYDVGIEDVSGCDRYVARLVTGLDPVAVSPAWLQRRLVLAGMRPISLAVDVTNHVMLDIGQPMHAFDATTLAGPIVVRRATTGERLRTLDDVDRELDPRDLVIADDSGPIALAGVMGGAATEITPASTDILLEAAHFDPVSIATTARRHRLGSEASRRFERGIDDAVAPYAAAIAARLLVSLGGGTALDAWSDADQRPARPRITMAASLPSRIAGVDYADSDVRHRLTEVGCAVDAVDGQLQVVPPSWRPDLQRPVDLVEEVVRLAGYAELPSTLPHAPAGRGLSASQRMLRVVGRTLAADGYSEIVGSPFTNDATATRLMLATDDARWPSVRVANPVSDTEPMLRATLLGSVIDAAARSLGRGLPDVAVFETGTVFRARLGGLQAPKLPPGVRPSDEQLAALDAALPHQPARAAIFSSGNRERPGWWGVGRAVTWADAIESVRTLARVLGVDLTVTADQHAPFHPGRCAALYVHGELVGHAGELHPHVIAGFDLPHRSCAGEISLDVLLAAVPEPATGMRLSAYPAATFDVALVVDDQVSAGEVEAAVRAGIGPQLESLRLFDRYVGEQLGGGRTSLAFSVRVRAGDRTLTAVEVTALRDAAVAEAARRTGAELRAV